MALVDVLRQLSGVDVQETVDLFMVHGVHAGFLGFGNGGGFVNGLPVAFRGAAGFVGCSSPWPAGRQLHQWGNMRAWDQLLFLDLRGEHQRQYHRMLCLSIHGL
ncbi:MAG: hypothetical protein HFF97_10715 [Oscillibacter sp.]|jgi:hypothetical protein|nr:hypothetical protein [Oscillibacter sp.]